MMIPEGSPISRAQVERELQAMTGEHKQEMAEMMTQASFKFFVRVWERGFAAAEELHKVGDFAPQGDKPDAA